MKVLLVVHEYFPDFSAGTEVLTRSVARELRARGHHVEIFTGYPASAELNDTDRLDTYMYDGVQIHRFHHSYAPDQTQRSSVALGYDNQLAARFFSNTLRHLKPDLVHFFHFSRLGTGLIDCAADAGIPAFFTPTDFWTICPKVRLTLPDGKQCTGPNSHGGNCVQHFVQTLPGPQASLPHRIGRGLPAPIVNALTALTGGGWMPHYPHSAEVLALNSRLPVNIARMQRLRKIVAPTNFMYELLKRHGIRQEQIVHLPFGIEDSVSTRAGKLPRENGPMQLAFIGTLSEHKGCHVAIEAIKCLPAGVADLTIYGSEEDYPDYARQLRESAKNHVHIKFAGTFPNETISGVLQNFDGVVVPSLWIENTPLILFSARAAGCIVIGSDFPGIAEVVTHDVNGLLHPAGDATALARHIESVAKNPGLLARLQAKISTPSSTSDYVDRLLGVWLE